MKDKKVTILIPTHERPNYLKRILFYYLNLDVNVFVADSSAQSTFINQANVKYLHLPGVLMMDKIKQALELITTEYVIMNADDDFVELDSVIKGCDFLSNNPDYSSVQGCYVGFEICKEGVSQMYPIYPQLCGINICQNSSELRLYAFYQNYAQLFYSLSRTILFKRVYHDAIKNKIENYNLVELMLAFYNIIDGKNKTLPLFWSLRESGLREAVSYGAITDGLEVIATSNDYKDEYERFINCISLFLAEKEEVIYDEAKAIVLKSMDIYISTLPENSFGKVDYSRIGLFQRIKGFAVEKIGNKIHVHIRNEKIKKYWFTFFYSRYYISKYHRWFVFFKYFKGAPFFSNSGIRELKKISEIVAKHPVQK